MSRSGTTSACPQVRALVPYPFEPQERDVRGWGGGLALALAALGGLSVAVWGSRWGALQFAISVPGMDTSGLTRWDDLVSWLSGLLAAFGGLALGVGLVGPRRSTGRCGRPPSCPRGSGTA